MSLKIVNGIIVRIMVVSLHLHLLLYVSHSPQLQLHDSVSTIKLIKISNQSKSFHSVLRQTLIDQHPNLE